jgi:hypothetical protein
MTLFCEICTLFLIVLSRIQNSFREFVYLAGSFTIMSIFILDLLTIFLLLLGLIINVLSLILMAMAEIISSYFIICFLMAMILYAIFDSFLLTYYEYLLFFITFIHGLYTFCYLATMNSFTFTV